MSSKYYKYIKKGRRRAPLEVVTCQTCHKEFSSKISSHRKFCSPTCGYAPRDRIKSLTIKELSSGTRICPRCNAEKKLTSENFQPHKTSTLGFRRVCKSCSATVSRAWYAKNPHVQRASSKRWEAKYPERVKRSRIISALRSEFGITLEEYDKILLSQSGKCSICDSEPTSTRLAVDHSHANGKIRGLLCVKCNTGLGFFRDSQQLLTRAIEYLKQ